MATYLVVAHQTATSPLLLQRLEELARRDRNARFALIVPVTHRKHLLPTGDEQDRLLVWDEREVEAAARERAAEARRAMEERGLEVLWAETGDESPLLAIDDELRARPGVYEAIVLSTLPAGRSRWVRLDTQEQAQRKFSLPVLPVHEGGEEAWDEALRRLERPARREPTPVEAPRRSWLRLEYVVGLMLAYLLATLLLAVFVDRGFLLNDLVAAIVFGVLITWLLAARRFERV